MIPNCSISRFTIAVDIVLTAPMHISALEQGRYTPADRRVHRYGTPPGSLPCTLTRGMEIEKQKTITDGEGEQIDLMTEFVHTIPANTLGGRMRRKAAELIVESLLQREQRLSVEAFNTLSAGTSRSEMNRSAVSPEQVKKAKEDPYLAVFGGTGYAFTADLTVHEGWPLMKSTEKFLAAPPNSDDVRQDGKLTVVLPILKKDDVMDMRRIEQLEQVIGHEAVAIYVKSIQDGRAAKNDRIEAGDESNSKKTELTTVATVEAVRPGVRFALRFDLRSRGPAHLGLALLCVKRLCDEGQIGGKANRGFGRFMVESARLYGHGANGRDVSGPTIFERNVGGLYDFTDSPVVAEAVRAAQDYIDNISAGFIEGFSSARPEEAPKAAKGPKTPKDKKPGGEAGEEKKAA